MNDLADKLAHAFALGRPEGELVHVRRGDSDAWRLDTTTGEYFIKGFLGEPPAAQLTQAMAFEQQALDAGVDMPTPVTSLQGWTTRIDGRLFRAYRWIEPHPPSRDLAVWLGRTMAQVHQLQPLDPPGLPPWWRQAVHAPAAPLDRDASWADLYADALPHLSAVSERIAELCEVAPDAVLTHGDFKPHNIVTGPTGPLLVDWDTVRVDSAALEAGRAAYIFSAGDHTQITRILTAYVAAGGELEWAGPDLFLSVARHQLQVLNDLIRVALRQAPAARWMGDPAAIDATIADHLRGLPEKLDQLGDPGRSL